MNTPKVYTGVVQHGEHKGTALGFPTANIRLEEEALSGIYAGTVEVAGRTYTSALYANTKRGILEAHLLDFSNNLYGASITITVLEKIRDDIEYTNEQELVSSIQSDIEKTRTYFEKAQK